ncbi:MAG TPA: pyrroline-5-carboxylate reductase [Pseudomonadales bacterium]
MKDRSIAFVGAGNMARSLIRGLLASGTPPERLCAADPDAAQREQLAALGVPVLEDNAVAIGGADVVVLAVKPQVMAAVLRPLPIATGQLVISIAAGLPLSALEAWTPAGTAIVRCMPNTPALLGAGITGLFANAAVTPEQKDAAERILSAAGRTLWVPEESALDAVTAVSGSGPAYFFYLMEAMIEAGEALGLDHDTAVTLTLETAYGAARMAREGGEPPAVLRANVTSPGGTTERALSILDAAGVRDTVRQAVAGAAARARELAEELGRP